MYIYTPRSFILASSQRNMWHFFSLNFQHVSFPATSNFPVLAFFGQENPNWRNRVSLVFRWTKSCSEHQDLSSWDLYVSQPPFNITYVRGNAQKNYEFRRNKNILSFIYVDSEPKIWTKTPYENQTAGPAFLRKPFSKKTFEAIIEPSTHF